MRSIRNKDNEKKVVEMLNAGLETSGKTLIEIAEELGYGNPSFLSNVKTGTTKVPMGRAVDFAKAFEINPSVFCKVCLDAYMPDIAEIVEYATGNRLTNKESRVLREMRKVSSDGDFGPKTAKQWKDLQATIKSWK